MRALVTHYQDVTEQRRTEAALRRMESMRDTAEGIAHIGSVRWDLATGKAEWSPETYRLFAMSPEEFDGDNSAVFEQRFHPDDRVKAEEATARALRTGVISPAEYRVIWPDGSEHAAAWRGDDGVRSRRQTRRHHRLLPRRDRGAPRRRRPGALQ